MSSPFFPLSLPARKTTHPAFSLPNRPHVLTHYYRKDTYYPYTPYAERVVRNQISSANERRLADRFRNLKTRRGIRLAESKGKRNPESLPAFFSNQIPNLSLDVREGPAHRILPLVAQTSVDIVRTLTMEYQFALDKIWEAFDELEGSIDVARSKGVFINLPVHIRFTAKSQKALLSHNLHDPTVSFSANFSASYPGAHVWLPELEQRLLKLGAKPHWGKIYYTEPSVPPEFERVRAWLEPSGMFSSKQPLYEPDPRAFQ